MKKLIRPVFVLMLFLASSCVDDLTSLNLNPKAYQSGTVPAAPFFSNATRNLVDNITNGFTFKILAQQFAETTYFDASSYNLVNVGNAFWVNNYNILIDYREVKKILADNPSLYAGVDKNRVAIIELLEIYIYSILVNTYGDVPYSGALNTALKSEALDPNEITPAYDGAAAIYDDLFVRLDKALGELNPNADSGGGDHAFGSADLIYNDDIDAWIKFGNSLKLRMAMTLADVNPTKAKSVVESISAAKLFQSNDDSALLHYLETTPNTNTIWVDLIQSEREDYVASNTMIDMMKAPAVDDPRIPLYYTEDNAGGYSGGIYGRSNSYVTFSKAGEAMTAPTSPGVLLDYVEVEFYLAEASFRGINVAGSAESHYNKAIKASIEYWGGTSASADAYLLDPAVAYATALGANGKERIARQRYLAMFNRGLEGWTEYRRSDFPVLNTPPITNGDFPIRYTYPNSEQTSNGENWKAADAAIGGDEVTNRVFWDTK